MKESESRSAVSDSLWSPWNSPGQNPGVGSLSFLHGIFPTQGSNPGLPHCRQILYQLSHKGSPSVIEGFQNFEMIQRMLPPPHRPSHGDGWGAGGMQAAMWTKKQDWPQRAEMRERNEFGEPRGLHLPILRMLNSLTWYLIFDVQTVCSLCCKLVCNLTSPCTSLEQFSQSYLDAES